MANPEYVLEMRDIVKVFPGVRALDGVKLQVRPGKVHVICGENGAGKSTLMKIINGTYVADEGEMFYKGEKIGPHTVQDTLKMGIAMIYQELNPVLEMTIAENIWLGREPRKGRFVDFGKMHAGAARQAGYAVQGKSEDVRAIHRRPPAGRDRKGNLVQRIGHHYG